MAYFYSTSTRGFYVDAIHGSNIPADAVSVTDDEYAALFSAQSAGFSIESDANGTPKAVALPITPASELRRREILLELEQIDLQSVRPLRAKVAGADTTEDERILSELEARASALRTELASLA